MVGRPRWVAAGLVVALVPPAALLGRPLFFKVILMWLSSSRGILLVWVGRGGSLPPSSSASGSSLWGFPVARLFSFPSSVLSFLRSPACAGASVSSCPAGWSVVSFCGAGAVASASVAVRWARWLGLSALVGFVGPRGLSGSGSWVVVVSAAPLGAFPAAASLSAGVGASWSSRAGRGGLVFWA